MIKLARAHVTVKTLQRGTEVRCAGVNLAVYGDLKDAPATFLQLDFIHVIADILDEKGLGLYNRHWHPTVSGAA